MSPTLKDKDGVWRQHQIAPKKQKDPNDPEEFEEIQPEQELIFDGDGYFVIDTEEEMKYDAAGNLIDYEID